MRLLLATLALTIAGCAATPAMPTAADASQWPEQRRHLQALEAWQLAGRVAVSAAGEGWSASLAWRQQADVSTIDVRGPFGAGAARLTVESGRATFDDGSGPVVATDDVEADLARRLGVGLPVRSLRYWVLGVPDPASAATEHLGPDGRLAALEQDGWRVEFSRYATTALGPLPGRITAERDRARLRLVVETWESARPGAKR